MHYTKAHGRSQRGANRILLWESEGSARQVAQQALAVMGYTVNAATGGAEVIGLYRLALEKGQPFEAVIVAAEAVDDIDGLEILENLRQLDPKVQVIVSGEDPEEPMMADCQRFGFRNRLIRPYGEAELAAVLSD